MLKTILIATLLALATSKTCKKCLNFDYTDLSPAMTAEELEAAGMGAEADENYSELKV